MSALIGIGILVFFLALLRKRKRLTQEESLEWAESADFGVNMVFACATLAAFFRELGYERQSNGEEGIDIFHRGDARIRRLPDVRPVRWRELPLFAGVGVSLTGNGVRVSIIIRPLPKLRISDDMTGLFLKYASEECRGAFDAIRLAAANAQSRRDSAGEGRKTATCPSPPQPEPSDLDTLGLKAGASWEEIQTAYRSACMKFHPDRLIGQNVAPHLADLALRHFKEVSTAYERLRRRCRNGK